MKKLFILSLLIAGGKMLGQNPSISPQVINSAGDHRQLGTTGIYITDNVGEPFTETVGGGNVITQGFIQPEVVSIRGFSLTTLVKNVTCLDKNDGEILIKITKATEAAQYAVTYSWTPTQTCTTGCDSLTELAPQTYSVNMFITYTTSVGVVRNDTLRQVIVLTGSNDVCTVKVYTGISANNDGLNDVLTIDNIEAFPKNTLKIFNRWGIELADVKGYNMSTNSWPTKDKLDNLVSSTYFYILDLGNGTKPIKGWVELIKN